MTWPTFLLLAAGTPAPNVTPVDAITSSVLSYILSYGVLGVVSLALAFRFLVPRGAIKQAREEARADLLKEIENLRADKKQAEEQRDEALKVANGQIVPLLVSFTSATQSLLPLLQQLVAEREPRRRG